MRSFLSTVRLRTLFLLICVSFPTFFTMPGDEALESAGAGLTRLRLLRQPHSFSGEMGHDVRDWLVDFNTIFDAAGATDVEKAKYLPLYLTGTPLLWFRSLTADQIKSMTKLGELLDKTFSPRDVTEIAQRNLWQRSLLPSEGMRDYEIGRTH